MKTLRTAMAMAFGLAMLLGARAMAADEDYGSGSTADQGASKSATGKDASKSVSKQAEVANRMVLDDQTASAMADLAIERSKDPKVVQYAQDLKSAHEKNITALRDWASQKQVELASVALMVPPRGAGGSGITEDEKKKLDQEASKYGERFRMDAREAQDDVIELSKAEPASFDKKFLSMTGEIHRDQLDQAKSAQKEFSSDAAFSGVMSTAQASITRLDDTAKQLGEAGSSGAYEKGEKSGTGGSAGEETEPTY